MSSSLERASDTLKDLQNEISKPAPPTPGQKPLLVEVRQPEPKGLESIANVVRPMLSPLATTALAILFLLFILLQREDIRDRFLRLAGTADLQRSTAALDDAAARLSLFFLMQTILNAGFGLFIGVGLWLIGVPNAVLWGILAGLMRFVPFVGSIIAAFFPIAIPLVIALALSPLALLLRYRHAFRRPDLGVGFVRSLSGEHSLLRLLLVACRPCFGLCCGDQSAFCSRPH
jgi:predicted PurR-regulated permease PerM